MKADLRTKSAWDIVKGDSPLIAAAIHDGHFVRENVRPRLAISDAARLAEEDPCTGSWTVIASNRIVGKRSRFEFDLNRPRDMSVYLHPVDSWGLKVWNNDLTAELVEESLQLYDAFYAEVLHLLRELVAEHRRVIVYDLHTYNHRRRGPYAECDDADVNPEVNVGTGTMDRSRWANVIECFIEELRDYPFAGRRLDVRENVKFSGGHFARWIHHQFSDSVCVLSIEFKKFFMNEWTGEVDHEQANAIQQALAATIPGVLQELAQH